eukprot:tig00000113_g5573.t1
MPACSQAFLAPVAALSTPPRVPAAAVHGLTICAVDVAARPRRARAGPSVSSAFSGEKLRFRATAARAPEAPNVFRISCEAAASGSAALTGTTVWIQKDVGIKPRSRGCHLIHMELLNALRDDLKGIKVGTAHFFLMHTSASLTINENASPDVPVDMEMALNRVVPESWPYDHADEGSDDMPAHVKSALVGNSLSIPIKDGRLHMGMWQGIWLCEHRNFPDAYAGVRAERRPH